MEYRERMKLPAILALVSLVFAGCASPLTPIAEWSHEKVVSNSIVHRDDFRKLTTVNSPTIVTNDKSGGAVGVTEYWLSAEQRDGEDVRYYLVLRSQRGSRESWAFWRSAADKDGHEWPMVSDSREVGYGAIVHEISSAKLDREYVEALAESGSEWRVYGERATIQFTIAPNLAAGWLEKCDATFAE